MVQRIDPSLAALAAQAPVKPNRSALARLPQSLSSGPSGAGATGGAAAAVSSQTLRAHVDDLKQIQQQIQSVAVLLHSAVGALSDTRVALQHVRALAIQATDESQSVTGRDQIRVELSQLMAEVERIANTTAFDTRSLLEGSAADDTPASPAANGSAQSGAQANTRHAVSTIETTLDTAQSRQVELDAVLNRLNAIITSLHTAAETSPAPGGPTPSIEAASTVTAIAKAQIVGQPATAMWAQASSLPTFLSVVRKPPSIL